MLADYDPTTLVHAPPGKLHLPALWDAGSRQRLHQPLPTMPVVAACRHQPWRPGRRVWCTHGTGWGAIRERRDRRGPPMPKLRTHPPQPHRTQRRPPGTPSPIRPSSPRPPLAAALPSGTFGRCERPETAKWNPSQEGIRAITSVGRRVVGCERCCGAGDGCRPDGLVGRGGRWFLANRARPAAPRSTPARRS